MAKVLSVICLAAILFTAALAALTKEAGDTGEQDFVKRRDDECKKAVPEPGVKFRIFSNLVDKMITKGNQRRVTSRPKSVDYNNDFETWWTLESTREREYYLIKQHPSEERLYANIDRREIGLVERNSRQFDDQLWKLKFEDGSGVFQLVNYHKSAKLFLRDRAEPHLGIITDDSKDYADQYFQFYFERKET